MSTATRYATVNADGSGNTTTNTHAVTTFVYDARGRLLQTIDARGTPSADPNDYLTSYTYDGLGRLLATSQWLDATHTRTTVTSYDDANNRIVTTAANGLVTTSIYDRNGQLVSVTESTPVLWSQDFAADAAGLTGNGLTDPNYMRLEGGRLVTQTQDSATTTYPALYGSRIHDFNTGVVFRAEVTTGATSAGRYLCVGAVNNGSSAAAVNTYRRHVAYFNGGNVYAAYYDPANPANRYPSVSLGAVKDNTTYVVELVTHGGGTTLYVYESGKTRESGFAHTLGYTDWGVARMAMWTVGSAGRAVSQTYVDNLSESLVPAEPGPPLLRQRATPAHECRPGWWAHALPLRSGRAPGGADRRHRRPHRIGLRPCRQPHEDDPLRQPPVRGPDREPHGCRRQPHPHHARLAAPRDQWRRSHEPDRLRPGQPAADGDR
ncbi:MAG: hypothetical protein M0C28_17665 [Candidatus Moduliflexus flocculans]|nr:hypothetical protein [Candidatus Moduliflexus flocculans]